jgi:Cys-tRNA(Pro)/Cys-tRNA(Cys) deacylase
MDSYQKIINILDKNNIKYKVHTHEEIRRVKEAKGKVDFDIDKCFKTLAFEYNEKFIFIALLAEDKLKYSKLCSKFNIKRSDLKKADSEKLEKEYGYESGGIAPMSISKDIIVIFDEKIKVKDIIFCGSGKRNKTIEISAKDIIKLEGVIVLDVAEKL